MRFGRTSGLLRHCSKTPSTIGESLGSFMEGRIYEKSVILFMEGRKIILCLESWVTQVLVSIHLKLTCPFLQISFQFYLLMKLNVQI